MVCLFVGLCVRLIVFRIVWIVVFLCHATHELSSDRFSQCHDNFMSMRSCQRRRVGFFRGLES